MPEAGIALLDTADPRWISFVQSRPEAHIFHHPAWAELLAACYRYRAFVVALCGGGGELRAGLPIMEVNSRLTGRRWVALPFSDHCVPLYADTAALSALIEGTVRLCHEAGVLRLELRGDIPVEQNRFRQNASQVLHTLALSRDAAAVEKRFHQMHRRNIRTARTKGVRIVRSSSPGSMREFYRLHVITRRRQGLPVQPLRFFDLLAQRIIAQGLGFVIQAYDGQSCIAAAVFLHWGQTLTYKYGASLESGLPLRPNNLIFWEAIQWGCDNGFALLDMGRTEVTNTGLRQFKQHWGAEERVLPYYSLHNDSLPQQTEGRLMRLMQKVIRSSPPLVSRLAGELLYRHFG